jgi:DNA invertase Pin-like site-specific DNA recombinase
MSRIEADHLAREAIVYVRQSTVDQVNNNVESRRRQYGLVERARQLGWADVSVIDDDLGRSGSGVSRPGFEKLLAAICEGRVGAVVSIEASRLARNGRDWHTLLEFCGLVGTLIADEDGVYDPRLPNDRLLLGMKGTMSEMELTILRQRAHVARKAEAWSGSRRSTIRSITSSPTRFTPAPMRTAGRSARRESRMAENASRAVFGSSGLSGTF